MPAARPPLRGILAASGTGRTGTIAADLLRDPLDLAVVGAGRVGTALGVLLERAGHRVVAVSGRAATAERAGRYLPDAAFLPAADVAAGADAVLICVPDARVAAACAEVAPVLSPGAAVAHVSGSLGLEPLTPARDRGATILSVHPLQTCPDVEAAIERIPGAAFAVTADEENGARLGERIATDCGGRPFRLAAEMKPLYHAAAVFSSNYLTTVQAIAERLLAAAGVEDARAALVPLAEATLANVARRGPAEALTGPAVRGDAETVERNLEGLKQSAPELIDVYAALARAAVELAGGAGRLDGEARARVDEILQRWT